MFENIWIAKNNKLRGAHYGDISFDYSSNICTCYMSDWVIILFAEMAIQCVVRGANRNQSAYIICTGSER